MKFNKFFCFILLILSASFCIYQATKKEDIYIALEDLNGYKYQFTDSTNILKTSKVLIEHDLKAGNQFLWEIDIDTAKIKRAEANSIQKLILNSQYFIINNFGFYGNENDHLHKTDKYQIYIIKQEKEVRYILPVKEVHFLVKWD